MRHINSLGLMLQAFCASVKYAAHVETISGKISTGVYSSWKGKSYMRGLAPSISNPRTQWQMAVRERMAVNLRGWRGLSAGEQALWEEYAQGLAGREADSIVVGGGHSLIRMTGTIQSGINAYCGCNFTLLSTGYSVVDTPPIGDILPAFTISNIAYSANTLVFKIQPSAAHTAHMKMRLFVMRAVKGGHSYNTGVSGITWAVGNTAQLTVTLTNIRIGWGRTMIEETFASVGDVPIKWQVQVTDETGRVSTPSSVYSGTVTT